MTPSKRRLIACLAAALTAAGCGGRPSESLPRREKRLALAYAEIVRMRADPPGPSAIPAPADSAAQRKARAVLLRHGFTPERFGESVAWLNAAPERWSLFYAEVQAALAAAPDSARAAPVPGPPSRAPRDPAPPLNKSSEAAPR
jgi:hypothetical protein